MNKRIVKGLMGVVALMFVARATASAQSGIFDRTGVIPGHGSHGSLPEEHIDLFTGNVVLRYRDVLLPGPNGLNVEVWRVYNSKILKDWTTGQPGVQAYHKSWVGIGWTMHMGMVHQNEGPNPVIEFPDGRREMVFDDKYDTASPHRKLTKDFLRYDKNTKKLYFQNGVIWTFGVSRTITLADGTNETVWLATDIRNSYGHFITVAYVSSSTAISTITDAFGRVITFTSSGTPRKLSSITYQCAQGLYRTVNYSVGTFSPSGYYKLNSVTPPMLPATTFLYETDGAPHFGLTQVTTSYGGLLKYTYANHAFSFNGGTINSRVMSEKRIKFNPSDPSESVWGYTYPDYSGPTGTVNVTGPLYNTSFTYNSFDPAATWKLGLIGAVQYSDGSSSETYDWAYQQVSDDLWYVLNGSYCMGTPKGALLSSIIRQRAGNSTLKEEYQYEDPNNPYLPNKRYGLPWKTLHYVNGSTSPINSKTVLYWFGERSSYEDRYLLSLPALEREFIGDSVGGTLVKEKLTDYYENVDGKWGATLRVRLLKQGSGYSTWDYDYWFGDAQGKDIQITSTGPHAEGAQGFHQVTRFSYGVKKSETVGDTQLMSGTISTYDSSVTIAGMRGGAEVSFTYDALGRVSVENWPSDRYDKFNNWRPNGENKVEIRLDKPGSLDDNLVTKYWDGMGRDLGYSETGDGVTLLYRKYLDAEGRVVAQNTGCPSTQDDRTHFTYNASGEVTDIADPAGHITHTTLVGTTKTVIDPNQHSTIFEYNHLPGLPTAVTDAQGHRADYTYDGLGRLTEVAYLNRTRLHTFTYDRADNLLSENHPETGEILYYYTEENWMYGKTWGDSVTYFEFYSYSGQVITVASGNGTTWDDEISYVYDQRGRVWRVTSSKNGWRRENIQYDQYDNVTSETVIIPGLAPKTITYEYDEFNNLKRVNYPDGHQSSADATSNSLLMPEQLSFRGNTLVSAASYGPGKAIASLTVGSNGTQYTADYYNTGQLYHVNLKKGAQDIYNATYSYDGAGNVQGITSSAPTPSNNASFGYDELNRLTSATYTAGDHLAYSYQYDPYGNMLTVTRDGVPQTMQYNSQNRFSNASYDQRGNLLAAGDKLYNWNKLNQLEYITNTSGTLLGQYLYDERGLRIRAIPPLPEINVQANATDLADGGQLTLVKGVGQTLDTTFTIQNLGTANLSLTANPKVAITGPNADQFYVQGSQPSSPVAPQGSTSFVLRFAPTSAGFKTATLTILNNDPDEGSYHITLRGNPDPDINVLEAVDGGSWDFGTVTMGEFRQDMFTIQNTGEGTLVLTGTPLVAITGDSRHEFSVEQQPATPILPGNQTTFIVRYTPNHIGSSTGHLSIASNDPDENPYDITLTGVGERGPMKVDDETAFDIAMPDGGEEVTAGSFQTISWTGGKSVKFVKLEYSPDNGSTYRTIVSRAPNTCFYEWQAPLEDLPSCLIRISDADGSPAAPRTLSFSFDLKVSKPQTPSEDTSLTIHAALPDITGQATITADLTLYRDFQNATETLRLNAVEIPVEELGLFSASWHAMKITLDIESSSATISVDGRTVLERAPLRRLGLDSARPEISMFRSARSAAEVWVENLEVRYQDKTLPPLLDEEFSLQPLISETFDRYALGSFPGKGGWVVRQLSMDDTGLRAASGERQDGNKRLAGMESAAAKEVELAAVDKPEPDSSLKSFKLKASAESDIPVIKTITLPAQIPYDVSAGSFAVVTEATRVRTAGNVAGSVPGRGSASGRAILKDVRRGALGSGSRNPDTLGRTPDAAKPNGSGSTGRTKTTSAGTAANYYLYSFDGKLLAEYDVYGTCQKDYIFMGDRLIAEYNPNSSQYHYYMQDQIRSTRLVTDDAGTRVWAEAYDPYGGIQYTWPNNIFTPERKFSDKERDEESQLDYFGTRYYANGSFRWTSIDPVLDREKAIRNSQAWNLYTYCANNPVGIVDPDGKELWVANLYDSLKVIAGSAALRLSVKDGKLDVSKLTLADILMNPGAALLYVLAKSPHAYTYSEGNTIETAAGIRRIDGVENLDNRYDERYDYSGGKKPKDFPKSGVDAAVVVDPTIAWVDAESLSKEVSTAAIALHELAEAVGKIECKLQYKDAHQYAGNWEQNLLMGRPDFTKYPAGGTLARKK